MLPDAFVTYVSDRTRNGIVKPIVMLLLLLGCGGARGQQSPPASRPLPLDYFVREIAAAGERERTGGARGVRVVVQGLPSADSVRVTQSVEAAFGVHVPIDSALRWLEYRLLFQSVSRDSVVVEFHENSSTRCRDGRIAGHGSIRGQLFRWGSSGWLEPVNVGNAVVGTSLPCGYR